MKLMKKTIIIASALFTLFAPVTTQAQEKLNPWKDCGIGALIFSDSGKTDRTLAAISNIIWDLGTTAVSSYASGTCSGSGRVAAAFFITETYTNVEEDTVKGNGDHISTMLDLMQCSVESRGAIMSDVQSGLTSELQSNAYAVRTSNEKAEAYFNILDNTVSEKYTSSCTAL